MKPNFNENYKGIKCRVCLVKEGDAEEEISLCNADKIHALVKDELVSADREIMLSILLTTKSQLIGVETVAIGSLNSTSLVPREIFKGAILANAASIVLCHNHPSGDLTPSNEDINFTKEMIEAGKLLGIQVLDHLIVSSKGFASLRDHMTFKPI
ncbi:MAG: JAB domain-containing protein [Deltaproteobacteria bacterium]|nr:JAB domain-containing protein [Deltaproteobacteria bacterium]